MRRLTLCLFLLSLTAVSAQRYTSAIGLRSGSPGVMYLNAKYRANSSAFELGIGGGTSSIWAHGNAYYQTELNNFLDYYYGLGLNVGLGDMNRFLTGSSGIGLGASGVLGLEHTLEDYPFNFSVDVGPSLYVLPTIKLGLAWSVSARYVLH